MAVKMVQDVRISYLTIQPADGWVCLESNINNPKGRLTTRKKISITNRGAAWDNSTNIFLELYYCNEDDTPVVVSRGDILSTGNRDEQSFDQSVRCFVRTSVANTTLIFKEEEEKIK